MLAKRPNATANIYKNELFVPSTNVVSSIPIRITVYSAPQRYMPKPLYNDGSIVMLVARAATPLNERSRGTLGRRKTIVVVKRKCHPKTV